MARRLSNETKGTLIKKDCMCLSKIFFASLIPSFLATSFHLFFCLFVRLLVVYIRFLYFLLYGLSPFLTSSRSSLHVCLYCSLFPFLFPSLHICFFLKVIGDKKGGYTASILSQPGNLNVLQEINQVVQVPMKFIHVHRNPFDNIATMLLRTTGSRDAVREEGVKVSKGLYGVFDIIDHNALGSIT